MKKLEPKAREPVETIAPALVRPASARPRASEPAADVLEDFRGARTALGQITADLERLRRRAGSLVKAAHRQAK